MGAQGTATLDFGAFPGSSDTSLAVTGQPGILANSLVEAWLIPAATADHTADEHVVETLDVLAGAVIAGTGFTIYVVNRSQLNEPDFFMADASGDQMYGGGQGTRIYGTWNVGWAWN
jgi:hypothetical protein